MKKLIETNAIVKTNRVIEIEEINGTDFAFYKDTKMINTNGIEKINSIIGATSIQNLKSIKGLEAISDTVLAPKMYEGKATIRVIKKSNFNLVLKGKKHISDVIENLSKKYYSDKENYMIVLWNIGSHTIADLQYNFISIPITFDYIYDNITNEYYDLEKLLKKLKNDCNVIDRDNLSITNIPYYNSSYECNKSIEFKYLLPNDIYQNVARLDNFCRHYYILEKLIGVDEFKINNCDDFDN